MQITNDLVVPDNELSWSFVRSGGPGGQNVNKVASKAVLRWRIAENKTLPVHVRLRLVEQQRNGMTQTGELILSSQRFRDQARNIDDCLNKLRQMVLRANNIPKPRRPTKPTAGSRKRRLEEKRLRTQRKRGRQKPDSD